MLFFLCVGMCYSLLKTIDPKEIITFVEEVTEEDKHVKLGLGILSNTADIFYRIIPPGEHKEPAKKEKKREKAKKNHSNSEDFSSFDEDTTINSDFDIETFEKPLERNFFTTLEKKGLWHIQVYNKGSSLQKFSISSTATKVVNKGNEDVAELKNLLNSVQNEVENLLNENYYAKNALTQALLDSKNLRSTLNWLLIMPVLTFGIAYAKYYCSRQLVKPKGKRFKGLF